MRDRISLQSPIDGKSVQFPISPTSRKTEWARGKCWSVFCRNPIFFVHLTYKANASHGYCHGCTHACVYENLAKKITDSGAWFALVGGRLEKWQLDPETLTFGPAPKHRSRLTKTTKKP